MVLGILESCSAHTVAVDLSEDALTSLDQCLQHVKTGYCVVETTASQANADLMRRTATQTHKEHNANNNGDNDKEKRNNKKTSPRATGLKGVHIHIPLDLCTYKRAHALLR